MRLHERVAEIQRMTYDPDPARIIAHAKYWADCEAAFAVLTHLGYGKPGDTILDVARSVPEATGA